MVFMILIGILVAILDFRLLAAIVCLLDKDRSYFLAPIHYDTKSFSASYGHQRLSLLGAILDFPFS